MAYNNQSQRNYNNGGNDRFQQYSQRSGGNYQRGNYQRGQRSGRGGSFNGGGEDFNNKFRNPDENTGSVLVNNYRRSDNQPAYDGFLNIGGALFRLSVFESKFENGGFFLKVQSVEEWEAEREQYRAANGAGGNQRQNRPPQQARKAAAEPVDEAEEYAEEAEVEAEEAPAPTRKPAPAKKPARR